MSLKLLTHPLVRAIALSALVLLAGCSDNDQDTQGSSTIEGNVAQVMTAMQERKPQATQVARWRDFFSVIATAHAQGLDLSGITVIAQLDGVTLDTTVTDASGNFTLNVSGGELTLVFMTDNFELTLALSVPDNSQLTLTVSLQPGDASTPVVVDQMDVTYNPIFCTSDTVTLSGEHELVIDGDGETCIRATGNCTIDTDFSAPVDIRLLNCERCLRAEGTSVIHLVTEGGVSCVDAQEDGIRARGRAEIEVQAGTTITVSAVEDGIDASGASRVHLHVAETSEDAGMVSDDDPIDRISITGATGIHAQGNATVDIAAPGPCAIVGTQEETLSQTGNASIVTACDE